MVFYFVFQISHHSHEFKDSHEPGVANIYTDPKNTINFLIECDLLAFFELGSCHYDFYLVNVRLPIDEQKDKNMRLSKINDLHMVVSINCVSLIVNMNEFMLQ